MRIVILGIVVIALGLFMWMWALQDASLFIAGGGWPYDGKWQSLTGNVLVAIGIALCFVAWLRSRRSRRN